MPAIDAVLTIWPPSPWPRICGRKSADAVQHAHQVDVEHPAPIVERDVVDAAAGRDAGIVANHMHIAEGFERQFWRACSTLAASATSQTVPRTSVANSCRPLDRGLPAPSPQCPQASPSCRLAQTRGPQRQFRCRLRRPSRRRFLPANSRMISSPISGRCPLSYLARWARGPVASLHDLSPYPRVRSRRHAGSIPRPT